MTQPAGLRTKTDVNACDLATEDKNIAALHVCVQLTCSG